MTVCLCVGDPCLTDYELVNSKNDRETPSYRASDYVQAILDTLGRFGRRNQPNQWKSTNLVSHLVHLEGGLVELDKANLNVGPLVRVIV
jgi:hypothetical protein